ncbi:MAG TPA: FkbM family methyltransferase [Candidatus Rifleibacterium sp.]|nr:FkbM family methyltransferase [Candidatus Rifleibacterium sp.]HPT45937.1 FkbM family methyltransferase [Candidatus Rifleibacterium sp.]
MNAFDIGANHGVYALSMARKLTTGHIWAFEPTQKPGSMLKKSIEINGFTDRITLVEAGLSDQAATVEIATSLNSELNSLYGNSGNHELIKLEKLDEYLLTNAINHQISFVKLDAEGEEVKILKGGQDFFTRQSPLVMFELKHGNAVNHGLIEAFEKLGYRIYRLLNDINILIEFDNQNQDNILNLFACKPDCIDILAGRGLLAKTEKLAELSDKDLPQTNEWLQLIKSFPYIQECEKKWSDNATAIPESFLKAFSACLLAHDKTLGAAKRVYLLQTADILLNEILKQPIGAHYSAWLLKIHLLHIFNQRTACLNICQQLCVAYSTAPTPSWPFILPSVRFFTRKPLGETGKWLLDIIQEFIEYRKSFSSYFVANPLPELRVLIDNPSHGIEIDRRNILAAAKNQKPVTLVSPCPLGDPELSTNSNIWQQFFQTIIKQA